jgi:tetratricopeptide (TPR) repeat protein
MNTGQTIIISVLIGLFWSNSEFIMKSSRSQTQSSQVENTINAIASSINAGQTIIFCGSGISRDSGFPVVNELVPFILATLCVGCEQITSIGDTLTAIVDDTQRQDRLKQIITEKMEVSPEVVDKIIYSLPFEAFVETLGHNSKIDEILEIYDAKAYQPHVEPNTNHLMLAKLIATGKVRTIVTTNFDQLIEKALEQQGKQAGVDYDVIYRDEDFEQIDWWQQDRCRLIKIHGSIVDKPAMAITLSQVAKKELSAARASIIRHVFSQGNHKTVLILGYSCSDVFDLSPEIENLTKELKQVWFVQHMVNPSDKPHIVDIREEERKNPFKAFDNSTRLIINTNNFVEAIWKATLKEPYDDHKGLKTTPAWKAKVQTWCKESVQTDSECIRYVISGQVFYAICEWHTAIDWYERVLAYVKRGNANDRLEEVALGNMGIAYLHLGECHKAIDLHQKSLEIARRTLSVQGEGVALGNIGNAYLQLGEYGKTIEFHQQCLEIVRRTGDMQSEGITLGNIGNAYLQIGEYGKAIDFHQQSLEMARRIGNVQGEGIALGNMGITYLQLGEYHKAIEHYKQQRKIDRHIGNVQGEGIALGSIGNAYLQLGEYSKAIAFYQQSLEMARRIGNVQGEGVALGNMGITYANFGDYRNAIAYFEQALDIDRRIGNTRDEGSDLCNIGRAYSSMGDKEKATQAFTQSKAIFARLGLHHMMNKIDEAMKQ